MGVNRQPLLKTGMVVGSAQVFTRYREKDITRIRSHVHEEKSKLTKGVIGYDANSLYLYCSGGVMPCGKDALAVNKKPFDQKKLQNFQRMFSKEKFLGFRRLTLKYLTSSMTDFVRCHHCLLFKRFLIVIYLKK